MSQPQATATPGVVKKTPKEPKSEPQAPEWSPPQESDSSPQQVDDEQVAPSASTARLVGRVVDPSVEEETELSPPSLRRAPSASWHDSFEGSEHPVRQKLLQKAKQDAEAPEPLMTPAEESAPLNLEQPPSAMPPEEKKSPAASIPPRPLEPLPPQRSHSPTLDLASQAHSFHTPLPPAAEVAQELEKIVDENRLLPPGAGMSQNTRRLLGALTGLALLIGLGELARSDLDLSPAPTSATVKPLNQEHTDKTVESKPSPAAAARKQVKGPWRINPLNVESGQKIISGRIGKEPFLKAIQSAGLDKTQAYRAYTSLKEIKNLDRCRSRDQFVALVSGSEKRLIAFEYIVSKEEIYQSKVDDADLLRGKKLDLAVERAQVRRSFIHSGRSFDDSASAYGFDPGLARVAQKALRGHMLLGEFRKGDRLKVIAQEVTVLGEFSRYAGIEAMEVDRKRKKESLRIYYFNHPTVGGYYDRDGKAPYDGGWRKPIPDAPITSKFNMKRMHPVLKRIHPHTGTDFGAPTGTPIHSTAPGTVIFIGNGGASGNLVKVRHARGYESGYAHLSRFVKGLKVGDKVDRMQAVGYCGSTGRSTGPHLHFTIKKDGKYIDAETLNLDGLRVLPSAYRADFSAVRKKYDPLLDKIAWPAAPAAPAPQAAVNQVLAETDPAAAKKASPPIKPVESTQTRAQPAAIAQPTVTSSAAPAPEQRPLPSQGPAQRVKPSSIFLSDAELLKMQSQQDEGEVNP